MRVPYRLEVTNGVLGVFRMNTYGNPKAMLGGLIVAMKQDCRFKEVLLKAIEQEGKVTEDLKEIARIVSCTEPDDQVRHYSFGVTNDVGDFKVLNEGDLNDIVHALVLAMQLDDAFKGLLLKAKDYESECIEITSVKDRIVGDLFKRAEIRQSKMNFKN